MKTHLRYKSENHHLSFMRSVRWNVVKMFTPPKSKSPWEAMTAGSTGGWAAPLEKAGWLGPALMGVAAPFTGGLSLLGAAGMGMAGMAGKGTGFQGTDKGWNNIGSTLLGGLAGAGLGGLGAGIGGAVTKAMTAGGGSLLGNLGSGFGQGLKTYMQPVTNLMGKLGIGQGARGTITQSPASQAFSQSMQNPYGQNYGVSLTGAANQPYGGGTSTLLGPYAGYAEQASNAAGGSNLLGSVLSGLTPTGNISDFNVGNIASLVMGGQNALGAWNGMTQAPQLQRNKEEALAYINTPDLVQARTMFRDLAMQNPNELLSKAGQTAIKNTLEQHRESVAAQQRLTLESYAAKGQIAGKSGAVDRYLRESEKNAMKQEMDYISQANYSIMLADTKAKIEAVTNYYNVSADQAAQMLQAEGYVNPVDLQNYMAAVQEYQTQQQLAGYQQQLGMQTAAMKELAPYYQRGE